MTKKTSRDAIRISDCSLEVWPKSKLNSGLLIFLCMTDCLPSFVTQWSQSYIYNPWNKISCLFSSSLFEHICFLNPAQRFWKHPTYPWLFVSSVIMLLTIIKWVHLGNRLVLRDHPWSSHPNDWKPPNKAPEVSWCRTTIGKNTIGMDHW